MNLDITPLLEQWDYQPGQVVVRQFRAKDGTEKIQLRVDLGLLQMNVFGRPDGKKPYGHESLLHHYQHQLDKHRAGHEGSEDGFRLKAEDCSRLQQEAIQYYHRYICLFQLGNFQSVISDTERNLSAFDFVRKFAASDDLSWSLQQLRPQLLMFRTRAKGSIALKENDYEQAVAEIESGLEDLRGFYNDFNRSELAEQSNEILSLESWLKEIRSNRPVTDREKMELALNEAIENEDYEKAAQIRDALRKMNK